MSNHIQRKIRVAVLMGGPSAEHDVSIISGKNVCSALDKEKYAVSSVVILRNGEWSVEIKEFKKRFDVVFIAMHGEFGEDGTVQSMLEKIRIPYTGSGPLPSGLGMNKNFSSLLFKVHNLNVPEYIVVNKKSDFTKIDIPFDMPWVVKPLNRGSSIGVNIVRVRDELDEALSMVFCLSRDALIAKYINGREITCGVIDDGLNKITPLAPTEIIPRVSHFFDYKAKYTPNASEELTPSRFSPETINLIQETAVKTHQIIGASGMSRTDMILSYDDAKLYILEINTIPGLTPISLLPQGAKAIGLSFPQLLDKIIQAAFNRYGINY